MRKRMILESGYRFPDKVMRKRMIPESGYRFPDKIMRKIHLELAA